MNVSSGGLSFDFTATNDKLIKIVEQSKQEIQGLADASKRGGKEMDTAFKTAFDNLDKNAQKTEVAMSEQRQAIIGLKKEIANLRTAADQAFKNGDYNASVATMEVVRAKEKEIVAREGVIRECQEALGVLDQEHERLTKLQQTSEGVAKAQQSLKQQLREVTARLAEMEATQGVGVRQTEEFKKLQQEAGRLKDALSDAAAQVRIFADDNALITGSITGLSGLAGAFSAVQGAMGLFGVENDKVQQAMLKVQSAIAITNGVQAVANALNKDSAFQLVIVRKAKDFLTASTYKLATALGVSTVAAKALMATLTLGLSVAITGIIMAIDKFTGSQKKAAEATDETRKKFEDFHKSSAQKSADLVSKYETLRQQYSKLQTEAEKTKWIKDNKTAMDDLGLAVDGVTSADTVFIKNTSNVVKALELRAKAMALQSLQTAAYEEYYKKLVEADNSVAGGGYIYKVPGRIKNGSDEQKELAEAMKRAGATRNGSAYNDGSWYTMDKGEFALSKKAIDAIQQLRIEKAQATNRKIREDAEKELNKTLTYSRDLAEKTEKEIAALKVLKPGGGTGDGDGGSGGQGAKKETEIYAEELQKRKKLYQEYYNYATSSEAAIREIGAQEFAPLLKEGSSYLDFLKRQQEALMAVAPTETVKEKLRMIQSEIAEATKEATIKDFETQLQKDLTACQTLGQMLDLLAERKKAIAGDDTEVGQREQEIIKSQEADLKAQAVSETQDLLQTYASYELKRLQFQESYARKRQLLENAVKDAASDAEKEVAEAALAAFEKEHEEMTAETSETYQTLLEEYKTHQQQLTELQEKFTKQRAEASAKGNISMLQLINKKEQEEVSKLVANQLMASDSWNKLFSDISSLSTRTIDRLIKDIEARKITLSTQLSPTDLKAVEDQLQRAREEIQKRNPFLALRDGLEQVRHAMQDRKLLGDKDDPIIQQLEEVEKKYKEIAANLADPITAPSVAIDFKDTLDKGADFQEYLQRRIQELQGQKIELGLDFQGDHELEVFTAMLNKVKGQSKDVGEALKETFGGVASSLEFVAGTFNSVVGGIRNMGIAMDEETESILNDVGSLIDSAAQMAQSYASGNILGMVSGAIGLFTSFFSLFNTQDRAAEKAIKKHEEALTRLKNSYNALEYAVKTALGEEVYKNQTALIQNLRKQQREVMGMVYAEYSKKNPDNSKITEYREQYAELGRQIQDVMAEITASITQTTAGDLANELADALVEAFESGTSAAEAFGEVANDVIKKAVLNALKLQFLEQPLQNAIKQLQKDMGFDEEGNGSFDGLTEAEQKRFKDAIAAAGANFQAAMDMYKDLFEQLDDAGDPTTLSGALKGASQESIDLLAGQTNAVRQNQVTTIALFRQQLTHLSSIDSNIGVIASRLLTIVNRLTTTGTDYRSQGLTL